MSDYYLGWGSPGWMSLPSEPPLLTDAAGGGSELYAMSTANLYVGVLPNGEVPDGVEATIKVIFSPADGSDQVITEYNDPAFLGEFLARVQAEDGPWYVGWVPGVYEITGTVGGAPCSNWLVFTVADSESAYAAFTYYTEGGGPASAFWTDFKSARELM